jgi:hypothetical protein
VPEAARRSIVAGSQYSFVPYKNGADGAPEASRAAGDEFGDVEEVFIPFGASHPGNLSNFGFWILDFGLKKKTKTQEQNLSNFGF